MWMYIFIWNRLTSIGCGIPTGSHGEWGGYGGAKDNTSEVNHCNDSYCGKDWVELSCAGFVHFATEHNWKMLVKVNHKYLGRGARCEVRDAIYCLPLLYPVIVARELAKERAHKYRLNGMNEWFICVHRLGHISALIYAVTWQKPARRATTIFCQ